MYVQRLIDAYWYAPAQYVDDPFMHLLKSGGRHEPHLSTRSSGQPSGIKGRVLPLYQPMKNYDRINKGQSQWLLLPRYLGSHRYATTKGFGRIAVTMADEAKPRQRVLLSCMYR